MRGKTVLEVGMNWSDLCIDSIVEVTIEVTISFPVISHASKFAAFYDGTIMFLIPTENVLVGFPPY